MNDDHTNLDADQIKLVKAFEAAATYFADRILNNADIDADIETETAEELVSVHGPAQANSKIADEAARRYAGVLGLNFDKTPQDIITSLKKGGNHPNGYFVTEALETHAPTKRAQLATECKNSVLTELYINARGQQSLPMSFTTAKLRELMAPNLNKF